ncbi:MAG: hypothetical protein HND56_01540 [Pseudomonadota bacterium]|nr:hypothetical protein [Pseudomonadota bacterium]QKK04446.1 MAG: hypothetical protein HND56_01540 [Pseudomonadota bacterium]
MSKKPATKRQKIIGGILGGTVAAFAAGLVGVEAVGYTDEATARDVLENQAHLQNVEITGKASFKDCFGSGAMRTAFTAEANGKKVEGAVCKTFFQPVYVRYTTPPPVKPQK